MELCDPTLLFMVTSSDAKCKSRQWSSWLQTQQKTDSGREDASGSLCRQKFTAENFPPLLLANPNFLCCAEEALLLLLLLLLLLFPLCCCVPFSSLSWMRGANVSRWKCCTGEEFAKITQKKLPKKSKLFLSFFDKNFGKKVGQIKKALSKLVQFLPSTTPTMGTMPAPPPLFPDVCCLIGRSKEIQIPILLRRQWLEDWPEERRHIQKRDLISAFFPPCSFPYIFRFRHLALDQLLFYGDLIPFAFLGNDPCQIRRGTVSYFLLAIKCENIFYCLFFSLDQFLTHFFIAHESFFSPETSVHCVFFLFQFAFWPRWRWTICPIVHSTLKTIDIWCTLYDFRTLSRY